MDPGVGIAPSPPPAQSLVCQKSRRLLGRSTAREGVLLLGVCHEMRRNNTIEELQGTRNPFIDHPKRVEDIQF